LSWEKGVVFTCAICGEKKASTNGYLPFRWKGSEKHNGVCYCARCSDNIEQAPWADWHPKKKEAGLELKVKLTDGAPVPCHAMPGDAGLDLTSREDVTIQPGCKVLVSTGVAVEIPEGHVGLVFPRSSCAKRGYTLANSVGVIDSGYRGEIHAALLNITRDTDVVVMRGERICQLVIVPFVPCECVPVEDLAPSERGEGGLGSTGMN